MPITPPPGGGPLFTVEPQLPVLGAPRPLGLDWCLQLTNVSIDLYPGHTLTLPPELDPIGSQQFALHLRACFGLACPDDRVVENLTAEMEAAVAASVLPGQPTTGPATGPRLAGSAFSPRRGPVRTCRGGQPVPSTNVLCSLPGRCSASGTSRAGAVGSVPQQFLKMRLDSLEIVDLVTNPPSNLEDIARVLPAASAPPRRAAAAHRAHAVAGPGHHPDAPGQRHLHRPARHAGPGGHAADVPDNPAVEDDQLKVFFNLKVD